MLRVLPIALFTLASSILLLSSTSTLQAQRGSGNGPGVVSKVRWSDDGRYLYFSKQKTAYRFDLESKKQIEFDGEADDNSKSLASRRSSRDTAPASTGDYKGRPGRGRQYTRVDSPDGAWEAHYENWNLVLKPKNGSGSVAVTADGNARVHYGTASWVYGEELNQNTAMWWTPDSKKILFYKFDDTGVIPFHLVTGWSKLNTKHYPEFYPKAGAQNPAAALLVYDLATKKTVEIDAGGGSEEYIYGVRASADGKAMLVNWTDRLQQHLKVFRIDLETGACTTIVEENQDTWQSNRPSMRYLADGHRFLWPTEKSGFTHYELRDLDGTLHHTVTRGDYQTAGIRWLDEDAGELAFAAYSSKNNPYYLQFHIGNLDGTKQHRVTSLDYHHSKFNLSPDRKWLVAQYEEVNTPPCTVLYDTKGKLIAKLAEADPKDAANLAEMFKFRSADDRFDIYGILYKPKDFDASKVYPVINSLYAGPGSNEISARYVSRPRRENGRGYLVVKVNNRGTGNRGKAFLGANYLRLGDVDIQDHADAIRLLSKRPYFNGDRVGIIGSSYGGYMTAMGVLKHPDVYHAGVNMSGVTDWRHYDTIYTERYMSTPQLNKKGYDVGRAMNKKYIRNYKRSGSHLLIMHGMIDDNVHPTNAFQLIAALDRNDASYESRFFPNSGHGLGRGASKTLWEFFDRHLKAE
ncbi:MAG: DPP IV N-terminal domain-containing protein [Planctomycetota bacterium]